VCFKSEQVLLLRLFAIQKQTKHARNKEMPASSIKETFHNCTAHKDLSSHVTEEEAEVAYRVRRNEVPKQLTSDSR
jgi:hypothetical protein